MPNRTNFEDNQKKVRRGEAVEEIWDDLTKTLDEKTRTEKQTLVNTEFDDVSKVARLQGKIQAFEDMKIMFEDWIKTKNKILEKRRDNDE